ncbi:hypothetical protein SERLA73DRAFT_173818 [Serpula lacrymans var. lacrymans S7.3]|uniref:DNA-binding protein RAP1 n=1 Tax=Serpula lacrymans var. lacrymans (strain S7.3) TaxID=936435 RepID=F8PHI0_SERL3|nr:hypothetical protein SERLA73DRAFT_173818 [Serpula lacrymans var. lacrymans S7.3]
MPIFQDVHGLAVKFFIQKDLAQGIQAELCETITSLGGRVETKVPRQGYVLVQNGSTEEERLRLCWASPDRPERHFVPYTYVEACKIAGILLKQIFAHDGEPIKMHIHPSIANVNARMALSQRIMHSGGDPTASVQSARIILADPNTEVFQHLVKVYQGVPNKYVESYLWVKKCIEKGVLVYTPLVYKNPGGRRPGEERTQFTDEDEAHLCAWIAAKIPFKETGGRTGNRLYQQLCEMAADPEYTWVTRHTWQSWRERYKKNAARLDALIAAIVDQRKPSQGEKGQYGYVRKTEDKPKRSRRKRSRNTDHFHPSDDEFLSAFEDNSGKSPAMSTPSVLYASIEHLAIPGARCLDRTSENIIFEELGALDEIGECAQASGDNELAPACGKRKVDEESEGVTNNNKKSRHGSEKKQPEISILHVPLATSTNGSFYPGSLHVIDQTLQDIARDNRFTVEEVQEYYDKCGEMERTRARFDKMRKELSIKFKEDDK